MSKKSYHYWSQEQDLEPIQVKREKESGKNFRTDFQKQLVSIRKGLTVKQMKAENKNHIFPSVFGVRN